MEHTTAIAFAIPSNIVKKVYEDLRKYGSVQRAILGVRIRENNAVLAKRYELETLKGVYLVETMRGSAAEKEGLESGDIILEVSGKEVNSVAELQEAVSQHRPGDNVNVLFLRGNETITKLVLLQDQYGKSDISH